MLRFAVEFPARLLYDIPEGAAYEGMREFRAPIDTGKREIIHRETQIAVIFVGHMAPLALEVCRGLKEEGYPLHAG